MAWETALDRLILRQIHLAERGDVRPEDVQRQVVDLAAIAPNRSETAFHLGYARALLGLDLREPERDLTARRWYLFGRLRGHDRRGESNWVADLLQDPAQIMDLLREPRIAAQCLPVAMRTLFWVGNLDVAVKAISYLASVEGDDNETLVDAALSDLLTRLERRQDKGEEESTQSILQKVIELDCFERLPSDVRSGYHRVLGYRMIAVSEFEAALDTFRTAFGLLPTESHVQSKVRLGAALAELRLHDVTELMPVSDRPERPAALEWLESVDTSEHANVPEAIYGERSPRCYPRSTGARFRRDPDAGPERGGGPGGLTVNPAAPRRNARTGVRGVTCV